MTGELSISPLQRRGNARIMQAAHTSMPRRYAYLLLYGRVCAHKLTNETDCLSGLQ